jgi:hypothetical protein
MAKKGLLVLIIAVFAAGGAFAQTDFASMAKNTITIDVAPTIVGFAIGKAADFAGEEGFSSSGFGIAGQYERQLSRPLSVAVRGAYLRADMKYSDEDSLHSESAKLNFASYSIEGHVRFYPFGDTFFLDGMAGYANLALALKGSVDVKGHGTESADLSPSRNYIKVGGKLGWRISFGRNGGFTFEPAIGYSYGIGLGDSIEKQISKKLGGDLVDLDEPLSMLQNFVFIGGPRLSLALGYRF